MMYINNNYRDWRDYAADIQNMYKSNLMSEDECLKTLKNIINRGVIQNVNHKINYEYEREIKSPQFNMPLKKSNKIKKQKSIIKEEKKNIQTPQISDNDIQKLIHDYIKKNIKIDFRPVTTDLGDKRWAISLYDKDEIISTSTMALSLFNY